MEQIEHRLFSFSSMNWTGRPLTEIRTVVELIAATKTKTGLTGQCAYDPSWYPTGVKITDRDYAKLPLTPPNGTATGTTPSRNQTGGEP